MKYVFESIREDIQSLSNIGRLKVWQAGCEEHFEIQNDYDLNEAIKYFGEVPESEVGIIKSQLKNSHTIHFFGFECDNSVIVGFEEHGYQSYVFPSKYSPN